MDIHTLLYFFIMIVIGFQVMTFYYLSKIFAIKAGIDNNDQGLNNFNKVFSLEKGLIIGDVFLLSGIALTIYSFNFWGNQSFGDLDPVSKRYAGTFNNK